MSKCSVSSTRVSNVLYWTLLRPKYWASADGGRMAAPRSSVKRKKSALETKRATCHIVPPWVRGHRASGEDSAPLVVVQIHTRTGRSCFLPGRFRKHASIARPHHAIIAVARPLRLIQIIVWAQKHAR